MPTSLEADGSFRRSKVSSGEKKAGSLQSHGVPAQEKAPAKLLVYLQRFRPQDYQRLLEADSSGEATGDSVP